MMHRFIPNSITCLNLLVGFVAILLSAEHEFGYAAVLICGGVLLDMLDGGVARRLGVSSHFGQELDSLTDIVVFGVAPATVLYHQVFAAQGLPGMISSGIPLICCALRLARFNLDGKQATFIGLPSPAAALILVSAANLLVGQWTTCAMVTLIVGALMVSHIPYPSHPPSRRRAGLLIGIGFVVLLLSPTQAIAIGVTGYGLSGVGRWVWSQVAIVAPRGPALPTPVAESHPPVNQTG